MPNDEVRMKFETKMTNAANGSFDDASDHWEDEFWGDGLASSANELHEGPADRHFPFGLLSDFAIRNSDFHLIAT